MVIVFILTAITLLSGTINDPSILSAIVVAISVFALLHTCATIYLDFKNKRETEQVYFTFLFYWAFNTFLMWKLYYTEMIWIIPN